MFEGEYLKGERNGKGKIYDYDGILIFEGQFLNNKYWKGNVYDKNDNIIYELNKENNIVKEYCWCDKIVFEGEYSNGKRNGKGKEYYLLNDNLLYEGEFLNGERNGKGKEYNLDDKLEFEGKYLKRKKWEGKGYDIFNNIAYILKTGKVLVKIYHLNGKLKFESEYLNG